MALVIDSRLVENDSWRLVDEATPGVAGDRIVTLELWRQARAQLLAVEGRLGLLIDNDLDLAEIAEDIVHFQLIAVSFPSFADGRAFSQARLLREQYGFAGQIRATGEVTRDRLQYMLRCGIDAFDIPDARFKPEVLNAFDEVTALYQGAVDEKRPAYNR